MRKLFENAFTGLAICSFILAGIINIESQMGENVMFIAIAVAIISGLSAALIHSIYYIYGWIMSYACLKAFLHDRDMSDKSRKTIYSELKSNDFKMIATVNHMAHRYNNVHR